MEFLKRFYDFDTIKSSKIVGRCRLCASQYSDKVGSTGNFHKHLRRKHKKEYDVEKKSAQDPSSSDLDDDNDQDESSMDTSLNKLITLNLVVGCNLPPSTVDQSSFRAFMKRVAPKWKPISSRLLKTKLIPTLASVLRKQIETTMNEIDYLSVTIDIWTDRRAKSFIGMTGHFLDINFKPQTVLLDFVRLKGRHTSENIRNVTETILEQYNIIDKVYRIITDNASNMVNAYKFGLTVVSDENSNRTKLDGYDEHFSDQDFVHDDDLDLSNPLLLTDPIDDTKDAFDQGTKKNIRLSCFAHSLQLAIRDGLTDIPILFKPLAKCNKLSIRSHQSTQIANMLDDVNKRLKRSNMTRWNSEYLMVTSILRLGRKTVEEIIQNIGDDDLKFNTNDFNILEELIEILEPFADVTLTCQSDGATSISTVVPSIVHVIHHLEQLKAKTFLLEKLISQLHRSIHIRFSGIVKRLLLESVHESDPFSDPIYLIATVLDPKFRFRWLRLIKLPQSKESKVKQSIIDLIFDECPLKGDLSVGQPSSCPSIGNTSSNTHRASASIKKRKLFDYDDDDDNLYSDVSELNPSQELFAYIDGPNRMNSLESWKSSRLLSIKSMVKRIFSVQASSAPIERVFSQSGLIMSPRRTSMRDDLFQSLVFLRVNKHLL